MKKKLKARATPGRTRHGWVKAPGLVRAQLGTHGEKFGLFYLYDISAPFLHNLGLKTTRKDFPDGSVCKRLLLPTLS